MSLSRSRRRVVSLVSLLALIAAALAAPLAHARAMQSGGGMAADICTVAEKIPNVDSAAIPDVPSQTGHATHLGDNTCCNPTTSQLILVGRPTRIAAADACPALHFDVVLASPRPASPWRAIQPRAPPSHA